MSGDQPASGRGADLSARRESPSGRESPADRDISADRELGGDPACWLNQVCDACGRLIEDPLADACPSCGTPR